jgi:hypothetical protein
MLKSTQLFTLSQTHVSKNVLFKLRLGSSALYFKLIQAPEIGLPDSTSCLTSGWPEKNDVGLMAPDKV